jgi:hypothetical protein
MVRLRETPVISDPGNRRRGRGEPVRADAPGAAIGVRAGRDCRRLSVLGESPRGVNAACRRGRMGCRRDGQRGLARHPVEGRIGQGRIAQGILGRIEVEAL